MHTDFLLSASGPATAGLEDPTKEGLPAGRRQHVADGRGFSRGDLVSDDAIEAMIRIGREINDISLPTFDDDAAIYGEPAVIGEVGFILHLVAKARRCGPGDLG